MPTIVIADTEFCTDDGAKGRNWSGPREYRDLTEIGAVRVDTQNFAIVEEFHQLVRPVFAPLTPYGLKLNGRCWQDYIDAPFFPQALENFAVFAGTDAVFCYGDDGRTFVENMALHRVNGFAQGGDGKFLRATFDKSAVCEQRESEILLALYGAQAEIAHRLSDRAYYLALPRQEVDLRLRIFDIGPWFAACGVDTQSVNSGRLSSLFGIAAEGEHTGLWDSKSITYAADHLIRNGYKKFFENDCNAGWPPLDPKRPIPWFSDPAASVAAPPYPGYP